MHDSASYHARTEDLVIQELGDELLIYDRRTDVAHCLSGVAALVWRTTEDGASVDVLVTTLMTANGALTREDAEVTSLRAISELQEKELIHELAGSNGLTRRHALRRIVGVGAGAALAPLVVSAAVPRPAEAFGSPLSCGDAGTACTTAAVGSAAGNTCCGANVKTCGANGCNCSGTTCVVCITSGNTVPATNGCSPCTTNGASNPCCCSGKCGSGKTGSTQCA